MKLPKLTRERLRNALLEHEPALGQALMRQVALGDNVAAGKLARQAGVSTTDALTFAQQTAMDGLWQLTNDSGPQRLVSELRGRAFTADEGGAGPGSTARRAGWHTYNLPTRGSRPAAEGPLRGPPPVVTEASIRAALWNAPLKTQQAAISLPAVQRYVDRLYRGDVAPPIAVDNGVIVEGNHRYVAGMLAGRPPPQTSSHGARKDEATDWSALQIDHVDWGNS
jgi:hypothetical protein